MPRCEERSHIEWALPKRDETSAWEESCAELRGFTEEPHRVREENRQQHGRESGQKKKTRIGLRGFTREGMGRQHERELA